MTKEDSSLRFRAEGVLRSLSLSLSNRIKCAFLHRGNRFSKKQRKSIRSSGELPIRVLCLRKEQVSIDSILYNRVEKLWRTSVNKSPTYRRISIDIVGLCDSRWTNTEFSNLFFCKNSTFYLVAIERISSFSLYHSYFEKTIFHFENYSGQSWRIVEITIHLMISFDIYNVGFFSRNIVE